MPQVRDAQTTTKRYRCVRTLLTLTFAAALLGAGPAPAKGGKKWWTYPMPPKIQPTDPMRIFPGVEVPDRPERFEWKITAPVNDAKIEVVPVYENFQGRLQRVGTVPVGTKLTLEIFKPVGRSLYYPVKFTPEGRAEITAWVNGNYVAPSGLASVQ